jgi:hypothetical protein
VAFVAIVWGVGTTFVAFEILALGAADLMAYHPRIFGDIALFQTVSESTSCVVGADEAAGPQGPAVEPSRASAGAWLLGVSLGRDALFRQYPGAETSILDQLENDRRTLAQALGVPPPPIFRVRQAANATIEFVAFVEQDPGGTAHGLALATSPKACELFKLGALWGYSEMIRPSLPGERAVFAKEIRHHARRAAVPEPLWSPMLQRLPANMKSDEVIAQLNALTSGITAHLANPAAQSNAPE